MLRRAPAPLLALQPAARWVGLFPRPPVAALRGPAPPVQPTAALRGLATTGDTSRYRGVSWYALKGQWRARLWVDKEQHLGYFADEVLAARAVDDELRELCLQEERGLNLPGEGERSWAEIEAERQAARERNLETVRARRAEGRDVSPFRGVSWDGDADKWAAQLKGHHSPWHIAYFEDEEDAARAVDESTRKSGLQEERGVNFPREGERTWAEIEAERQAVRERNQAVDDELRKLEEELKRRGATAVERNREMVRARRAAGRADSPLHDDLYLRDEDGKWHAQLTVDGTQQHVGYFEDEKDAARARDECLREWRRLNPPPFRLGDQYRYE